MELPRWSSLDCWNLHRTLISSCLKHTPWTAWRGARPQLWTAEQNLNVTALYPPHATLSHSQAHFSCTDLHRSAPKKRQLNNGFKETLLLFIWFLCLPVSSCCCFIIIINLRILRIILSFVLSLFTSFLLSLIIFLTPLYVHPLSLLFWIGLSLAYSFSSSHILLILYPQHCATKLLIFFHCISLHSCPCITFLSLSTEWQRYAAVCHQAHS